MDGSPETQGFERRSLARSIAAGGNGIVAFGAALALAWYSAATLFMLFAGILFGVFLTAMADLLRRVFGGNQTLRLVIVCLLFTGLLSGVVVLGGATIAQQATALSSTLRAQLGNAKDFLEKQGIDTSFLNVGTKAAPTDAGAIPTPTTSASPSRGPKLPTPAPSPPEPAQSSLKPSKFWPTSLRALAISSSSSSWGCYWRHSQNSIETASCVSCRDSDYPKQHASSTTSARRYAAGCSAKWRPWPRCSC